MAARVRCVNASEREELSPLASARALQFRSCPPAAREIGAGEGNRTLVVSLEGFCSTIELHPLGHAQMPMPPPSVNPQRRLTARKPLPYHAIRMTHLDTIAASSTARLWWWRSANLAARWRD